MEWRVKIRGRSGARPWLPGLVLLMLLGPLVATAEAGAPDPAPDHHEVAIQGRGEGFPMNDPSFRPSSIGGPDLAAPPVDRWTNLSPSGSVPVASGTGMFYVDELDTTILIGPGLNTTTVWAYNATTNTWTDRTPGSGPLVSPTRSAAYSANDRRYVMFGGYRSSPLVLYPETWVYDPFNNTWENRTPAISPPVRIHAAMVYDPQSRVFVLYGGCFEWQPGFICNNWRADLWFYRLDTNTWTKRTDNAPIGAYGGMAFSYDPIIDRMLIYGGWGGAEYSYFTWSYDFDTNTWKNLFPTKYPGKLSDFSMSYDPLSRRHMLFSGWDPTGPNNNDTWTYSATENLWFKMNPPGWPPPRGLMQLAYDSKRDKTMMFGGTKPTLAFNDTWSYELQNVPSEPLNFTAGGGVGKATLSWTRPVSDGGLPVTNFRVYRGIAPGSLTLVAEIANVTGFEDLNVSGGNTYYYRVAALSSFGQGAFSNLTSTDVTGPPQGPSNVQAVPNGTQISVTWDPPSNDGGSAITGYRIYRGESTGVYTQNFTTGNVTSYVDGTVVCGRTEYYAVAAINTIGEGSKSTEVNATPCPGAAPPRILGVSPPNGTVDVPIDSELAVAFSEDMDPLTTGSAFQIFPTVTGQSVNVSGKLLTFRHSTPFRLNTTYTFTVATSATSLANLSLGQTFSSAFTTRSQKFSVTGVISDSAGAPLSAVPIVAFDAVLGTPVASSIARADGGYRLDLEGGRRYYLEVTLPDLSTEKSGEFDLEGDIELNFRSTRYAPVPRGAFPWFLIVVGLIGTLTGLAAAALLGGEAVLFVLLLIPIVLYSRIHREKVLDHFVRGQIYGHIRTNPGATFTEIGQVLGVSNGVLTYHLYTLERTEFIRSGREGRWKRFWPREAPKTKSGVMVSKLQKHILDLIKTNPGISQAELAVKLGTKRQNVNYNVQKLVSTGLVRLDGWGFRKRCVAVAPKEQEPLHTVEPGPKPVLDVEATPKPPTK